LAGLKLPGREAVDSLSDKCGCGGIAHVSQIIGELSQVCEGVHSGGGGPPVDSLSVRDAGRYTKIKRSKQWAPCLSRIPGERSSNRVDLSQIAVNDRSDRPADGTILGITG